MIHGFDVSRFTLGALCQNEHDFQNTGLSLRSIKWRKCLACDREHAKKKRIEITKVTEIDTSPERLKLFFNKTQQNGDCLEWQGYIASNGYGRFHAPMSIWVHKYSYMLNTGINPGELFVCHKCDNRKCVSINHLFLGTAKDNSQDMVDKGRSNARERNPNAKINSEIAKEIKQLRANQFKHKEIMNALGVSRSCVEKVLSGETWQ